MQFRKRGYGRQIVRHPGAQYLHAFELPDVLHLLNDTIRTSEDVEKYLGINVLGLIPLEEGVSKRKTHGRDATAKKKHSHKKDGKNAA